MLLLGPAWGGLHYASSFCFPFQKIFGSGIHAIVAVAIPDVQLGDHPWLGGCCLFLELTWLLATGPPAVGLLNQTAEEQRGGGAGNSMKRLYLETSKFQWKLNIVACIIKG